jgi:hypothetical protein
MVGIIYLIPDHAISIFSLPLNHQCSNSRLYHTAHSHISISHVTLFSPTQHHHSRFNHFIIYFVDNEFEKKNPKKLKYDTSNKLENLNFFQFFR